MTQRLKILISAYACSPYQGSEPGVGWGFIAELAKRHDLWVLVEEEKYRDDIERFLAESDALGKSVQFFFLRKQRNRSLRKVWPPSYYWYYRRWHKDALALAGRLHRKVHFDVVHQLTMVGFREPGYLWKLGVPFVWGPIGGMGLFPWRFLTVLGVRGALYYFCYNLINAWQMRFLPRSRRAAVTAGVGLISATPENREAAQRLWGCSSTLISEVGLPPSVAPRLGRRGPDEPLGIIWVGQHTAGKALNIALSALAHLPKDGSWELNVLGSGDRTRSWQKKTEVLGLKRHCHFHGWLPRDEAVQAMARSHLMLITSLRDLTSTVTVEALASGLPIVCLDHCGFSAAVDSTCGIKIAVTTPGKVALDIAEAIRLLLDDEDKRLELAMGAAFRAQAFSWPIKAELVSRIYSTKSPQRDVPSSSQ